jgi:hypothetical protein
MRTPEMTHGTERNAPIIAPPPFDPNQPLPVSRARVCIGLLLLISGFAVGGSSSFFPAAKLLLRSIGLLLIIASFFVLGLHRSRSRGRDPRKLYGHRRI